MNNSEQPLVSIIIPVYNTEKFVGRALESVLEQTYKNIEVIVVNDGSQDGSGEICDEYSRRDSRVIVVHQINSGVSAARNKALEISRGRYIQFVDSDDVIVSHMTETFVTEMENSDCDIVICGFANVGQERQGISAETRLTETRLFAVSELLVLSYKDSKVAPIVWSSCNMMFKNDIMQANELRFNSSYAKGEDGLFTLDYLSKCKKALVLDQVFYIHYIYDPLERVSTVSQFAPDLYELRLIYFERLYFIVEGQINEQQKTILLQLFYDKLIAGIVRMVAYSEHFTDIEQRLSAIVNNEIVIRSGKVYKRFRKGDSVFIPLFMKWRLVNLLYFALKKKKKHYIGKYGKSPIVRSIYVKAPDTRV
ncbi:glycosyltransferase family 2 protein [Cohnella panacarvi]|uniref:glycosyltransferase family 2 protein n=1 Tax=Cohnella panacarvi TaxID=400776 RepID=UPI00047D37D0|nr:glycosyltransferase [Cohnella panacarvi]